MVESTIFFTNRDQSLLHTLFETYPFTHFVFNFLFLMSSFIFLDELFKTIFPQIRERGLSAKEDSGGAKNKM